MDTEELRKKNEEMSKEIIVEKKYRRKLERELTNIPLDGSTDFQFVFTMKSTVEDMQILFVKGIKEKDQETGEEVYQFENSKLFSMNGVGKLDFWI